MWMSIMLGGFTYYGHDDLSYDDSEGFVSNKIPQIDKPVIFSTSLNALGDSIALAGILFPMYFKNSQYVLEEKELRGFAVINDTAGIVRGYKGAHALFLDGKFIISVDDI